VDRAIRPLQTSNVPVSLGEKNMTKKFVRLKDGLVRPGDIVLTTTSDWLSGAIRVATFGDISHAMVCVADSSVIDATSEGVHARNVQRIALDASLPVHVLRPRSELSASQLSTIETFLRGQIGVEYSKGAAAQSLLGGGRAGRRQFCSRLVAQAFEAAEIQLVDNPNFCFPAEILRSPLLVELPNPTDEVSAAEAAAWEGIEDVPQRMRDAINGVLKGARALSADIQTFDDLNQHLLGNPGNDAQMLRVLRDSGYLTVWLVEMQESEWQYDLNLMAAMSFDQAEKYCRRTLESERSEPNRFVVNRGGYLVLHLKTGLDFFAEMRDLYERLADLHRTRVRIASLWLESKGLLQPADTCPTRPHTTRWFEELAPWDARQAAMARVIIDMAGSNDVCTVCGDDPAADYVLIVGAPAGGPGTLKLCDDCLQIRRAAGEPFQPFP